jgi:hypothetical protein
MVPPPRHKEQSYCGSYDDPSNQPKQIGLPHGWREHDNRRADQQAEGLFCIVRSRGACERLEEALGKRWFYKYNPRETNEENTKSHDDYSCK